MSLWVKICEIQKKVTSVKDPEQRDLFQELLDLIYEADNRLSSLEGRTEEIELRARGWTDPYES